jgi:tRNA A37 methylthiotransferase MiaB
MNIFISEDDMCTTQKLNLARVHKWFEANDCKIINDANIADKVLVMTCNGFSLLEDRSLKRIQSYKNKHSDKMITVGCMVDSHPEDVAKIWDGPVVKTKSDKTMSFSDIENLFPDFNTSLESIPAQSVFRRKEDYREYNLKRRFINIAEGCAFACSFCTHKPGLGGRRSRKLDDILTQVNDAEKEGIERIILMGMETAMYGIEHKTPFPMLLDEVMKIKGDFEVHIAQFNPFGVQKYYDQLIKTMVNKRITDFQAPFQSTSKRILGMMNRKYFDAKTVSSFMKTLRKDNTRVVCRTDMIVGWPTETEQERQDSLEFAADNFDEVAVYSIEFNKDLPAWKYADKQFSKTEIDKIQKDCKEYLVKRGKMAHAGQQEDETALALEANRIKLRESKKAQAN